MFHLDRDDLDSNYTCNFELCKATSGAIRFQVKSISGYAKLFLSGINTPHNDLFEIILCENSRIRSMESPNHEDISTEADIPSLEGQFQEFWLTWYGDDICLGHSDDPEPFLRHKQQSQNKEMIGYIKFVNKLSSSHRIEWMYERSPITSKPLKPEVLRSGDLRWDDLLDGKPPPDALIAGFENEPLYIACALHEGNLCPGKYVHSKRRALVPWGGREHVKNNFQILCGYNATWVKTGGNKIPQNAFIGGQSEVRGEPLYIGRAVHEGHLINGKIHVIYETCYLPYQGKEVEKYSEYEILVLPDLNFRGILGASEFDM